MNKQRRMNVRVMALIASVGLLGCGGADNVGIDGGTDATAGDGGGGGDGGSQDGSSPTDGGGTDGGSGMDGGGTDGGVMFACGNKTCN